MQYKAFTIRGARSFLKYSLIVTTVLLLEPNLGLFYNYIFKKEEPAKQQEFSSEIRRLTKKNKILTSRVIDLSKQNQSLKDRVEEISVDDSVFYVLNEETLNKLAEESFNRENYYWSSRFSWIRTIKTIDDYGVYMDSSLVARLNRGYNTKKTH